MFPRRESFNIDDALEKKLPHCLGYILKIKQKMTDSSEFWFPLINLRKFPIDNIAEHRSEIDSIYGIICRLSA